MLVVRFFGKKENIMKISTEISSISKFIGEEKAVEYVAKAGFDAWDFSMFNMCDINWPHVTAAETALGGKNYLQFARKLRMIGENYGITCNQSHAPFPSGLNGMESFLKRAIECTAEAGGKICIIHPNNDKTAEENAEMYVKLLEFAKGYHVKIATENMFNWDRKADRTLPAACCNAESFLAHLQAVNDDDFVACLDIGHAEIMGEDISAEKMIYALGDKLQALHLHDNDKRHDSHQIPGSMSIDFNKVVQALKKIGYKGYFTLEAVTFLDKYNKDNIMEGLLEMKKSARNLADQFELL